jgi:hypothetical protein
MTARRDVAQSGVPLRSDRHEDRRAPKFNTRTSARRTAILSSHRCLTGPCSNLALPSRRAHPYFPCHSSSKHRSRSVRFRRRANSLHTPAFAGVGQPVVVQGTDFEPGKTYQLNRPTVVVVGNRMTGRGWEEVSRVIAKARTDTAGGAESHFNTPDDLGGVHTLWTRAGMERHTDRSKRT